MSLSWIVWPIFWIMGLALLIAAGGVQLSGLQGESLEFFIYVLAGSILPIVVLAFGVFDLARFKFFNWIFTGSLAAFFFYEAIRHSFMPDAAVLGLAALQTFLVIRLTQGFSIFRKSGSGDLIKTLPWALFEVVGVFAFSLLVWNFSRRLLWWDLNHWLRFWPIPVLALILAFVLSNLNLLFFGRIQGWGSKKLASFLVAPFIGIIGLASFRPIFDFYHAGFYLGPAQLVRQGGQLLWDVPSQYGFLNILLVALLPVQSTLVSLYIINSLCIFTTAALVFFIFKKIFPGLLGLIFSLFLALGFMILVPGDARTLAGPNAFPSVGGLRFVGCYALFFLVWLMENRRKNLKPVGHLMQLGHLFWLLGVWWASESAVYCSGIWLSYYFLHFFWQKPRLEFTVQTLRAAAWGGWVPVTLLASSVGGIALFYQLRWGHFPDWSGYVEYAMAYKNGFYALPVDPVGGVWILVLQYCAILALLYQSLKVAGKPVLSGVVAAIFCWVTSSYYVSRSHENNVLNLLPVYLTALLVTWDCVDEKVEKRGVSLLLIPIITVCLMATFGNRWQTREYFSDIFTLSQPAQLAQSVPVIDEELEQLMRGAHVSAQDRIVVLDSRLLGREKNQLSKSDPTYWLPVAPESQICILPQERRKIYFARFFAASPRAGGWLILPKANQEELHCLADFSFLAGLYQKKQSFESKSWILNFYLPE